MKLFSIIMLVAACGSGSAYGGSAFTNFIRQVQVPSGVQWDMPVSASGEQRSPLAVDEGGSRFELWTVETAISTGTRLDAWSGESFAPITHLLDTRFVGTYVPVATVSIRSEDSYALIPRTRADRPFFVDVSVDGLLSGVADPEAAKAVKLLRHAQSYGAEGTGEEIDRTQATLLSQSMIEENGILSLSYTLTSIPFENRTKVRGEERFSVFSQADEVAPEAQLASKFIQIWPLADATISGISDGDVLRLKMPYLTLTLNDLYPDSRTYAQVYRGSPQLGMEGKIVPGSSLVVNDSVPKSRVLTLEDYASVFDDDGVWTMEIVTITPFGIDRLTYVSFEVDRVVTVKGMVTVCE